jgi:hypothetical protein
MGSPPVVSLRGVVLFLFLLEVGSLVTGGLAVEAVLDVVDELATEGLLARPVVSPSSDSDDPINAKGGEL